MSAFVFFEAENHCIRQKHPLCVTGTSVQIDKHLVSSCPKQLNWSDRCLSQTTEDVEHLQITANYKDNTTESQKNHPPELSPQRAVVMGY